MSDMHCNGVRLFYEEHGEGEPILCIHGTGSSAAMWEAAVAELARHGRVIAYDRRGCSRSERPVPSERTSVAEQADDAAALLDALGAREAFVIGRSYGAEVALDLALRHPGRVRALALLEGGPTRVSPAMAAWCERFVGHVRDVAATGDAGAVARVFIGEVLGAGTWDALPAVVREMFTGNVPAILAELTDEWLRADGSALPRVEQPALLVAAGGSHPAFRDQMDRMAEAMPAARRLLVDGGHLIDPAHPAVVSFLLDHPGAGTGSTVQSGWPGIGGVSVP